jgi:IS30 family transposase
MKDCNQLNLFENEKCKKIGELITLNERKLIHKWIKKEISLSNIAKKINRPRTTIFGEVRKNGGRYKYNWQDAQKRSDKVNKERIEKICKYHKSNKFNPYIELQKKIGNIEMHIEILIDEIKQIKETKYDQKN